jgi:hypothetical protein
MKLFTKKAIKQMIHGILIIYPELRDNDERLAGNIIYQILVNNRYDVNKTSALQLLKLYSEGCLPTIDYITRVRRKLQEEIPELRGEKYVERHRRCGKVINEINAKPIESVI